MVFRVIAWCGQVTATDVLLNDGTVIPYGIAVWAAGIGPLPVTLDLISQAPPPHTPPPPRARGAANTSRRTRRRAARRSGYGGAVAALGDSIRGGGVAALQHW